MILALCLQHPERRKRPEPDLVRAIPRQRDNGRAAGQQRKLMIKDRLHRETETFPASDSQRGTTADAARSPSPSRNAISCAPQNRMVQVKAI